MNQINPEHFFDVDSWNFTRLWTKKSNYFVYYSVKEDPVPFEDRSIYLMRNGKLFSKRFFDKLDLDFLKLIKTDFVKKEEWDTHILECHELLFFRLKQKDVKDLLEKTLKKMKDAYFRNDAIFFQEDFPRIKF